MLTALGNVFDIGSGGTPSKKHTEYYDGDIPWVKTGDLKDKDLYVVEDYITEKGLKNSSAKMYEPGTVLIAMYGATIGAVSILRLNACTNQACAAFKPCKAISPEYLYYFLRSKKQSFIKDGVGGAQPNISAGYLKKVEIDLRPLDEQNETVTRLNLLDSIIHKRQQEIKNLDNLVKARFVEMFGNPFDPQKPVAWQVKTIKDLAESIADGSNVDKTLYKEQGDILFLRIQNVWCNEFRLDDSVYISEAENEVYLDTALKHGDLLITKIGRYYTADSSLGRVSVYLGEDNKANYSNNIMRVRFREEINSEFVNALMNLDDYNKYIRRTSVGGTDKRALSKGLIASYPIIVPSITKQNEFVDFVHQVDKSKVAIQKSLEETQLLFDSLMQQYFG